VGQHFNIDWNRNARLSRISGVVPNLFKFAQRVIYVIKILIFLFDFHR